MSERDVQYYQEGRNDGIGVGCRWIMMYAWKPLADLLPDHQFYRIVQILREASDRTHEEFLNLTPRHQ